MKRREGELPYELLERFLDSLLEIHKRLRPKDSVCIALFCDIYVLGLSTLPKELKPQDFE